MLAPRLFVQSLERIEQPGDALAKERPVDGQRQKSIRPITAERRLRALLSRVARLSSPCRAGR